MTTKVIFTTKGICTVLNILVRHLSRHRKRPGRCHYLICEVQLVRADYIIPKECERCKSDNIAVRVMYDTGITRYLCLDCGYARSIAKEENLKKRTNTSINNWAQQIIKYHPFCYICGGRDNLEAHHIIPVSHSQKYKFTPTNGITLCKDCHWLVHNFDKEVETHET